MSDFKTLFIDLTSGTRYSITDVGIEEDQSLATAVIVSLFTDKRDVTASPNDARGWWADDIGSLRWTLSREKQTEVVLNKLVQYDTEALQWMKETGLVLSVSIQAKWVAQGVIEELITLTLPNGQQAAFSISES